MPKYLLNLSGKPMAELVTALPVGKEVIYYVNGKVQKGVVGEFKDHQPTVYKSGRKNLRLYNLTGKGILSIQN